MDMVLASLGLVVCGVLGVRLMLGVERRRRFDARMHAAWHTLQAWVWQLRNGRAARREASRMADEVIKRARAREEGAWEGNVFHPDTFKRPRKPH